MVRRSAVLVALLTACGHGGSSIPDAGSGPPDASGGGDPDAGDLAEVVTCPDPVPAATEGTCNVTKGTGSQTLVRGTVLAPDTIFLGGGVLYDGDHITCVGCNCAAAATDATLIECKDAVVSPGLINPHDHITFTEGAPIDHGTTRYAHRHEWRGTLPAPSNPHGAQGTQWGELRMLFSGVTSMIGSGGADGLVRNLDRTTSQDVAEGLAQVNFETFPLGDSGKSFRPNCGWNYKLTEQAAATETAYLPHVAEGINDYAAEEFRCESTSFDGGHDFTEANDAHIHGIGLDAAGYLRMAQTNTKLIWSPRSNLSLYGMTAGVTAFARLGGTIALGTDWTYSGSANELRELSCADGYNRDYLGGYFTDRQLWQMATINGAKVSHADGQLGALATGKLADLAVFAGQPGESYRAVIEAQDKDVALVVRGGAVLYGEADVVQAIDPSCESLDVCGAARAVCAQREFGTTYAALATTVAGAYAAIFCDATPAGEPTCVPSRPGEYTGEHTADDADGDGIANATDDCPTVFNPIRPIDQGVQADVDGDGLGDACDPSPAGDDLDGDGVPNASDNCVFKANADQVDADSDGKGDVCDFCPSMANPSGVCGVQPPMDSTVEAVQMGTVSPGTSVTVPGLVVTGLWTNGAWVEDPAGGPYSGIQAFVGGAPGVAIGDVVTVTGKVTEFHDDTELAGATITKTGSSAPPAPVSLTAAEAATEAYEGVLVTITDVTTVVNPYTCTTDDAACADANLWQINGQVVVFGKLYTGTDFMARAGQGPVTGVMSYRFNTRRIMPRSDADIGPAAP